MGAGVSYIAGADAHAAAIDVEFEVRIVKSLSIATRAQVPLAATEVQNGRTIVKVSPGVISIGPSLALAAPESFFVPRLGTGIGFVWLRTDATGAVVGTSELTATGQARSNALTTRDDIVSPMAYVGASASLHIAGPVRFVFEGQVGSTAHRMVVRDQGTNIAYFGQPFGTVAGRGEIIFR